MSTAERPGFVRAAARYGIEVFVWCAFPALLAGLLVRFTVRDHFAWSGVIFYATPWPVLWLFAVACFLRWRATRLRHTLAATVVLCLAAGLWTMVRVGTGERPDDSFRVAYWNVARPESRLPQILETAGTWRADVLVFGEYSRSTTAPDWMASLSPKTIATPGRGLLLAADGLVKRMDGGSLGGRGGCQICRVQVKDRQVFVLMVDFDAQPHLSREPAFKRLREIVSAYSTQPLIVLGDFNTPADSVHFAQWKELLSSAFDTAGHGYTATWPMPAPVLQLDQIWTNKHLRCVRAEHITSLYSDHRAVVADFVFAP